MEKLEKEIKALRSALEFYADKNNHKMRYTDYYSRSRPSGHYRKSKLPKVHFDKGKIARKALEDTGE